jgi:hypothetical protein
MLWIARQQAEEIVLDEPEEVVADRVVKCRKWAAKCPEAA